MEEISTIKCVTQVSTIKFFCYKCIFFNMWTVLIIYYVLLSAVQCVPERNVTKFIVVYKLGTTNAFDSRYWWPQPAEHTYFIEMECRPMFQLTNFEPRPPSKTVAKIHISIQSCILPKIPLAKVFEKMQLNITKIKELKFIDSVLPTGIPEDYTAGLKLKYLELKNVSNFNVKESFFKKIRDLTHLRVDTMEMPHLPPGIEFRLLGLTLKETSLKRWENCESLSSLTIIGLRKEQIPEWPQNCLRLRSLELSDLTQETVTYLETSMAGSPNEFLTPLTNIRKLVIKNCSLDKYPMIFLTKPLRLKELDLSNNPGLANYFEATSSAKFPLLKNLTILNMAHCNMVNEFFVEALPGMPKLEELNLHGNQLDMKSYNLTSALSKLNHLQHLSVQNISFSKYAFQHHRFQNLSNINWSSFTKQPTMNTLMLQALPSTNAATLEVDLRGYSAKYVDIGPDFHKYLENTGTQDLSRLWLLRKGYKLTVWLDSVDCDCTNGALAIALRNYPHYLSMPGLKCTGKNTLLLDEPMESLQCVKASVNGCIRRMNTDTGSNQYTTVVDCSNVGTLRWPKPQGFKGFNASGNRVTTVKNAYLPETLEWIDLSNNRISRMRPEDVARLFTPERRVWFRGNPVICDCGNRELLEALKTYQTKVQDFDTLVCSNNGQLLRSISIDQLCRIDLQLLWVILGILTIITAVTSLILNHYWSEIKARMYSKGWFLYCLKEQDIDSDRPYDAFISFAHGDNEYVTEYLIPKLEGEPNFYKLCLHYRDWTIGEWIPYQIMNSVRESKRTIIVLSKNFVTSWWGALEFRHAYAKTIREGRNRLLVLVLDDVLNEDLSSELKQYLSKNTYLKCDDPWFWDKLLYAMPHKVKESREKEIKSEINEAMSTEMQNTDANTQTV